MLRPLDIWRCIIVRQEASRLTAADLDPSKITWLPPARSFTFRADPFGLWLGHKLYIFVEAFDYRTAKGSIELLVYNEQLQLTETGTVLSEPWHLSYPFVFHSNGEFWMLPEARESGELTLYRARSFPYRWERAFSLGIAGAVDATPVFHDGRWWLFYCLGRRKDEGGYRLNLVHADSIAGPWTPHPLNPVRSGLASARPGGSPLMNENGTIDLPVQDCRGTYGGGLRRLRIHRLSPSHFEAEDIDWLEATASLTPYQHGIHTLCAAGDVTLLDCKLIDRTLLGTLAWRRGQLSKRHRNSSSSQSRAHKADPG